MKTSETVSKIVPALLAIQKSVNHRIEKSKTADVGKYSYDYTPIEEVVDLIKPLLIKNDLVLVQGGSEVSDTYLASEAEFAQINVVTRVFHKSGEWVESVFTVAYPLSKLPVQEVGKAVTYMRRYALTALFGVTPVGEDTDGLTTGNGVSIFNRTDAPKAGEYKGKVATPDTPKPVATKAATSTTTSKASSSQKKPATLADRFAKKATPAKKSLAAGKSKATSKTSSKKGSKTTKTSAVKSAFPKPAGDCTDEVFNG